MLEWRRMEQPTEEMEGMLTFCDYNGLNDR